MHQLRPTTLLCLMMAIGLMSACIPAKDSDDGAPDAGSHDSGGGDTDDTDTGDTDVSVRPAKFEPEGQEVLVFAGQDNESVGANAPYTQGYYDLVDIPAGISHYMGIFDASQISEFDVPPGKHLAGLYIETSWGSGPICLDCYLKSEAIDLTNTAIHLSVAMTVDGVLEGIPEGESDFLIDEMIEFLLLYPHVPFFIRIGYEFDGSWNGYSAAGFKAAFIYIVDKLRASGLDNYATVMSAVAPTTSVGTWERYYPGNGYVDWVGYSYWGGDFDANAGSIKFAKQVNKPIMIAESTPRGSVISEENGQTVWNDWFDPYFAHIAEHPEFIKAIAYINANWDAQPQWQGQNWGDTRIQNSSHILEQWRLKMEQPTFITGDDPVFTKIRFQP